MSSSTDCLDRLGPLPADVPHMVSAGATRLGKTHKLMGWGNEDTFTIVDDFIPGEASFDDSLHRLSYFGVFDGHGGGACSKYCARSMHDSLASLLMPHYENGEPSLSTYQRVLGDAFLCVDKDFCAWAKLHTNFSGSCATIVLATATDVMVANAGDCAGRLVRFKNGMVASSEPLNARHTCFNLEEAARVRRAGGRIVDGRVNGVLEPTRAVGDIDMKTESMGAVIIASPEVRHFRLDVGEAWTIVLGTDGLFDAMTDEAILSHVEGPLTAHQSAVDLAERLCFVASLKGDDDVTVVVAGTLQR